MVGGSPSRLLTSFRKRLSVVSFLYQYGRRKKAKPENKGEKKAVGKAQQTEQRKKEMKENAPWEKDHGRIRIKRGQPGVT